LSPLLPNTSNRGNGLFNHATFPHNTGTDDAKRSLLLAEFKIISNNTYYGDGSSIEPSVLDELREAYRQEQVTFPWQEGDVLMLDNMSIAHGRESFVVQSCGGMAEPFSSKDI